MPSIQGLEMVSRTSRFRLFGDRAPTTKLSLEHPQNMDVTATAGQL